MTTLVIADTHLPASRSQSLIDLLGQRLQRADAIVHAGDVTAPEVLHLLAEHAPVHAVAGNNDVGLTLPVVVEAEIDGVLLAITHDSGASTGRDRRLAKRFPTAEVVIFGHSHLPWNVTVDVGPRRQHHFNPGSPTQRRRAPEKTIGWIERDGRGNVVCRHETVS